MNYGHLSNNVIYAGAAPGLHIEYLSKLYPSHRFYLYDPNEFKIENYGGKEVVKPTFDFKLKEWKWFTQFENNQLTYIGCRDEKGHVRFQFGTLKK